MKELDAEGGAPAGVSDRLLNTLREWPGVDGGLDSNEVLKDMLRQAISIGKELGGERGMMNAKSEEA